MPLKQQLYFYFASKTDFDKSEAVTATKRPQNLRRAVETGRPHSPDVTRAKAETSTALGSPAVTITA